MVGNFGFTELAARFVEFGLGVLNIAFPTRPAEASISGPCAGFNYQSLVSPDIRLRLSKIAQLNISIGYLALDVKKPTFRSLHIRFTCRLEQNLQRLLGIAYRAVLKG